VAANIFFEVNLEAILALTINKAIPAAKEDQLIIRRKE